MSRDVSRLSSPINFATLAVVAVPIDQYISFTFAGELLQHEVEPTVGVEYTAANIDIEYEEDFNYGYPSFGMAGTCLLQLDLQQAKNSATIMETEDNFAALSLHDTSLHEVVSVITPNVPGLGDKAWSFTEPSWGRVFSSDSTSSDLFAFWSESDAEAQHRGDSELGYASATEAQSGSRSPSSLSENNALRSIDETHESEVFSKNSSSFDLCDFWTETTHELPSSQSYCGYEEALDCIVQPAESTLESKTQGSPNTLPPVALLETSTVEHRDYTLVLGNHDLDIASLCAGSSDTSNESEIESESLSDSDECPLTPGNEFISLIYNNAFPLSIDSHREYYALARGYEQRFDTIAEGDEDDVSGGIAAAVSSKSIEGEPFEYACVSSRQHPKIIRHQADILPITLSSSTVCRLNQASTPS
ncbi:hypothetical protein QFC24_002476 [Naganishia onofrii]|uniref:Uncharacterized protein n=1 Tax=Naganishia onofrii TaxID=1851511 RepID=A0ACC2XQA6_9TREE|nr:hypothetical protein QFC24_002476 [Naganishia onofrii]